MAKTSTEVFPTISVIYNVTVNFCKAVFLTAAVVSSIVYEVIRTISSLFMFLFFVFFYEKILSAQKHVTSKNQLTKQKQGNTKQQRQQYFARTKTSKRAKIVCLRLDAFLTFKIFFKILKHTASNILTCRE